MADNYWTSRWSRRRMLGAATAVSGAAFVGAACGDDDGATPAPKSSASASASSAASATGSPSGSATAAQASPTAAAKRGGSISTMVSQDPVSLDLHQEQNVFPQLGSVYSKLLKQVKGGFSPDLATAMPETPDEKTLIFKLRQGVKFHNIAPVNGRAMTADDVKYSLQRVMTNDAKFQSRRLIAQIEKIDITDPTTLKLSLSEPFAPIVPYLAYPTMVIVPREAVEVKGDLRQGPLIGTGPFQSKEVQPGVRYVNTRFDGYFEAGKPYVDEFTTRVIPDRGTAIAQLRSGDLTFMYDVSPDELSQVKSSVKNIGTEKGLRNRVRTAMNTQVGIFKDPRVRKAVHLATDRQEMIDLMSAGEGEIYSVLPSFFPGALKPNDLQNTPGFRKNKDQDITEAKQLLQAAGFPNGLDIPSYLSLQLSIVPDAVTIHAKQLAKAGIRATIQPISYADWTDRMLKHEFEIAGGITSLRLDPDDHFFTEYHSKGPRNDPNLKDATIDGLIEQQRRVFNETERAKIWRDLDQKMLEALPYVPFFVASLYVTWQPRLLGLTTDAGRMNYFGHILSDVSLA